MNLKLTIILFSKISITSISTAMNTYDIAIKHVRRCDRNSSKIKNVVENNFQK